MTTILDHLIIYWPIAVIGTSTGLVGWLIWIISISVSNTRWRKAIQNGRYADEKVRERIREQKFYILFLERDNAKLKKQNTEYKNMIQSVAATVRRREE